MKKYILSTVIGVLLVLACLAAMLLPEQFLKDNYSKEIGKIKQGDVSYFGVDLLVDANELSYYDKVMLMGGNMEKRRETVEEEKEYPYTYLTLSAALEEARKHVLELNMQGHYPVDLESSYLQWYYSEGALYQYIDEYFGTYSCTVWELRFRRFDRAVEHVVYVDAKTGELFRVDMFWNKDVLEKSENSGILLKFANEDESTTYEELDVDGETIYLIKDKNSENYSVYFTNYIQS